MTNGKKPGLTNRRSEQGAALVVSLILLLVMTLLGITALNSSTLQTFMSSNLREQTVRLADAESILLRGEFDVELLVSEGVGLRAAGELPTYLNLTADGVATFPASNLTQLWPADSFVIEYMGDFLIPGESVAEGGGFEDSVIHVFRVSARSDAADLGDDDARGGTRIVQSLYVTLRGPDQ